MILSIVKRYVKWNELAAKAVQEALDDLKDDLDALEKRVKDLEDAQPSET